MEFALGSSTENPLAFPTLEGQPTTLPQTLGLELGTTYSRKPQRPSFVLPPPQYGPGSSFLLVLT